VMVGGGWLSTHEEFNTPFAPFVQPPWIDQTTPTIVDHDTGAMSIIVADDTNGVGIRGIAPSVSYSYVSHELPLPGYDSYYTSPGFGQSQYSPGNAVNRTTGAPFNLGLGDVLIIESGVCVSVNEPEFPLLIVEVPGYLPNSKCVFQEYKSSVFDAIDSAVKKGITVISPAHNSGVNHDQLFFNGRYTRGHSNYVDSGAIIVGSKKLDGTKRDDSNYGSRIDVSALGESIYSAGATCGGACLNQPSALTDPNQVYNSGYGGTSGAAPIVAGAVVVLQSLQKARGGKPIPPKVMRQLLREIGTLQLGDLSKRVGRTPDVRATWEWMIADDDGDGMLNIDELIEGRNPKIDERKALILLLGED
jgi:subtilisin family serine protease